ncbi:hypothetical protein JCM11641_006058 [Rhodosporidiobolus odoratus]
MDLPATTPGQRVPIQQQQRPSLTYFLFLSLLFYLINSNNSPVGNFAQLNANSTDAKTAYAHAQANLLRREARAEGLARWLGAGHGTSDYLNSTFWPDVANGTAPLEQSHDAEGNSTALAAQAFRIPAFTPSNSTELPPVMPLVQSLFGSFEKAAQDPMRIFPQNLTGFGKGTWEVKPFSWAEMGLNETWQEEREIEMVSEEKNGTRSTGEEAATRNATTSSSSARRFHVRQSGENSTVPIAPLEDSRNFTTITTTFNRTNLRGSFPWLPTALVEQVDQRVSFNLRSVQTSATGPVLPLRGGMDFFDDGELLQLKGGDRNLWEDWEREGPVVYLSGDLMIKRGEEETSLDVEAVHFLSSGRVYGFATPSFIPSHVYQVISLPFVVDSLSSPSANRTAHAIGHAMLHEVRHRIRRKAEDLEEASRFEDSYSNDRGEENEGDEIYVIPQCVFSLFGALSPLPPSFDASTYAESYASLFHPTGSSAASLPPALLSTILSSHNCGLVLSLPSTRITLTQSYWSEGVAFVVCLAISQAIIVVVMVRQLEKVQGRPGTISNVALVGIAGMCLVDAYLGTTLATVGIVTASLTSIPLLAAAFFGILSSLLFGLRYIALIRDATPDRPPVTVPAAPAPMHTAEVGDPAEEGGESAGLLSNAEEQGTWDRSTGRQKVLSGLGTFVSAFGIYLLFWWGWTPLLFWVVYSYWIPQIVRNVQRGTARQSLSAEFVVGNTVARLLPPLYFWGREDNCLQVETSPWIYLLAFYSILQSAILLLQSRLSSPSATSSPLDRLLARLSTIGGGGSRFFLPRTLVRILELHETTSWNYHPVVLPDSLLADLTATDLESGKQPGEIIEPDCPICLTEVQVVASKEDLANGRADGVRLQCAVTPCRHVVHTECLEQWMLVRAICPVCRSALPPLR